MDFCSVRSIQLELLQQQTLWCHLNVMQSKVSITRDNFIINYLSKDLAAKTQNRLKNLSEMRSSGPILPDGMKVKVKTAEKGDEPRSLVSVASSNQTKWRSFSPSWLLCTIAGT